MSFIDNNSVKKPIANYHKFYDKYSKVLNIKGPWAFRQIFSFDIRVNTLWIKNNRNKTIYVPFYFEEMRIRLAYHDK